MYDLDIVEDTLIIEWGESKPSKKYVSKELSATLKEKARRVVEWLKTAESESSEEESDEDGEIAFDERAQAGTVTAEEVNKPAQTNGTGTVFYTCYNLMYFCRTQKIFVQGPSGESFV